MSSRGAVDKLLQLGLDDWVSADEVIWTAAGGDFSVDGQAKVLEVLDDLYRNGLMVPGQLGESGFEDWPDVEDEYLARSEAELERHEWRPMGAGFWLRLTKRGAAQAHD